MPKISIALATFNGQKFLSQQLESLAGQQVPVLELVVCDDGSSDNTLPILRKFATQAPFPVHVIQNPERLGYRLNFIKAANNCSGDLIAFCDQDDVWHSQKLEVLSQRFADPSVQLVYHNATLTDEVGAPIASLFGRQKSTFEPLTIRPWLIVPGLVQIFRRSLLRFTPLHDISVDPYNHDHKMPHDLWCLFWASVMGKIVYVPEKLVEYRQHDDNTSGWPYPRWPDFLRDNILNAETYAVANAVSAANRLALLRHASDLVSVDEKMRIQSAISFYAILQRFSDSRVAIYRGRRLIERAEMIYGLWKRDAYGQASPVSLGPDALFLDLTIGLPFSRYGRAAQAPATKHG